MKNSILIIALILTSCVASKTNNKVDATKSNKIIFLDEFNTKEAIPNPEIWTLCTYANNAWSQHFKDVDGYENVKIQDGCLKISATKVNGVYKNGGIRTKKGFPKDTRVEIKARLNKKVRGGFPAIWQMPVGGLPWPRSGEIDIMEWVQKTPNRIYQTIHTYYSNGDNGSDGITNPKPKPDFDVTKEHIYALDRTDKELIFYVDGNETRRYENLFLEGESKRLQYPFTKIDFDIILNFSLGGLLNGNQTWPGKIADEDLPGEMWIDWVKVTNIGK